MAAFIISLISFTVAMGLCYTVLMLKREGGIDSGLFRAYAIQSFSVMVWCIGYTFMFYTENQSDVILFYKISAFGWALLPSSNLYLVWRLHKYMKGGKERPWLSFLVFIPYPVFLAAMTSENFMVFEFRRTPYGWIETIPFTIMTLLYICAILTSIAAYCILLIIRYKTVALNKHRTQLKMILIPALVIGIIGIFQNIIFSVIDIPRIPPISHILVGGWTLLLGYLILHYPVLNIRPQFIMETILNNMQDIVILTDRLQNIVTANSAAEKMLGFGSGKLNGVDAAPFFDDCERRFVRASLYKEKSFFETDIIDRNGGRIPCQCSIQPIRDKFDDPVGYAVFAHDIRDLKILESLTKEMKQQQEKLSISYKQIEKKNENMMRDLELARQIQNSLIARTAPAYNGAAFSMIYQPMDAVGGDLYDFVQFKEREKIGLFISDVSGHGVPAALIAGMIKTLLMTSGRFRDSPDGMLSFINQRIIGKINQNFATAFYCVYDANNKTLRYARAGHPHPFLIRDGKVSKLEGKGVGLGFMADIKSQVYTVSLKPGDKVLLYTDGLLETPGENGIFFEEGALENCLAENAKLPVDTFTAAVFDALNTFRGDNPIEDDVCLLCMEIL